MRITKIEASYIIDGLDELISHLTREKHFRNLEKTETERLAFLKALKKRLNEDTHDNRTGSRTKTAADSYHDAMVKRYLR